MDDDDFNMEWISTPNPPRRVLKARRKKTNSSTLRHNPSSCSICSTSSSSSMVSLSSSRPQCPGRSQTAAAEESPRERERLSETVGESCPICLEALGRKTARTSCKHVFCRPCLNRWLRNGQGNCPMCRTKIKAKDVRKILKPTYKLKNLSASALLSNLQPFALIPILAAPPLKVDCSTQTTDDDGSNTQEVKNSKTNIVLCFNINIHPQNENSYFNGTNANIEKMDTSESLDFECYMDWE